MEKVGKTGDPFDTSTDNGPSMEARLLLPLKSLIGVHSALLLL
jgi:hypothetical protein